MYFKTLCGTDLPKELLIQFFFLSLDTGPILESKGLRAIFQKKGKKRAKHLKIRAKMYKI